MFRVFFLLLFTASFSSISFLAEGKGVYQTPQAFVADAFSSDVKAKALWLNADIKEEAKAILGHELRGLRLRYWGDANRSAWVLEEIGKEKPITVGVVVNQNAIENLKVLIFRESRGWEVRHDFFTEQFKAVKLTDKHVLDRSIDGVTGATLSVRALTRIARLALFLHGQLAES